MKRCVKIITAVLILTILTAIVFAVCSFGKVKVHNVFDQICNEVNRAERRNDSVLLSGPVSAERDYEFGSFMGVSIEQEDYRAYIDYNYYSSSLQELVILISKGYAFNEENPHVSWYYKYNVAERKVYYSAAEGLVPLLEVFLPDYFKWCSDSGKENPYSKDNLGDVSFETKP